MIKRILIKKHLSVVFIVLASFTVHFLFFGQPKQTVFDEVHFGKFVSGYFTHQYFFDIHPPLGKLLISGAGYISGYKTGFSFSSISDQFPNNHYLFLRLLPTLAGSFLPLIVFFLIRRLKMSKGAAFTGAMLIILENSLLVQSRFILLDLSLLFFGFSAFLIYLKYRQEQKMFYFFGAISLASLALSVKWTGVSFLGIIGLAELVAIVKLQVNQKSLKLAALIFIPFLIYFGVFYIHFKLLTHSGEGDNFMSDAFRKTLIGSNNYDQPEIKPLGVFSKFIELNRTMYTSNAGLTATHPNGSRWYEWPILIGFCQRHGSDEGQRQCAEYSKPVIYYWTGEFNGNQAKIYLSGNPLIWWLSTLAVLIVIAKVILSLHGRIGRKQLSGNFRFYLLFLLVYIFNILPFIGVRRVLFLYHYFPALITAIIALVFILDQSGKKKIIFSLLIFLSIISFVYFSPISYGRPMSEKQHNRYLWIENGWR